MNTMNMPGFTADNSLYCSSRTYNMPNAIFEISSSTIEPQIGITQVRSRGPIIIEPEECITRCYFIGGVPIICYEVCF